METINLTQKEFDDLLEYSLTLPTGQRIGKRWKRDQNVHCTKGNEPVWIMGEYTEHEDPNLIGIKWRKIEVESQ